MIKSTLAIAMIGFLALTLAGCSPNNAGSARADVRYRVFEVPMAALDDLLPPAARSTNGGEAYETARPAPAVLEQLIAGLEPKPGMLAESLRSVGWWPHVADTWAYSRADGELLGGGTGTGFLGVRAAGGGQEFRLEYSITHSINLDKPFQAEIQYEGPAPVQQPLVFVRPFVRADGTARAHVISFETMNWQ